MRPAQKALWLSVFSKPSYFPVPVTDILNRIRINRILNYLLSRTWNNCLSPRGKGGDEFLRYKSEKGEESTLRVLLGSSHAAGLCPALPHTAAFEDREALAWTQPWCTGCLERHLRGSGSSEVQSVRREYRAQQERGRESPAQPSPGAGKAGWMT